MTAAEQPPLFFPAATEAEATARILALTGVKSRTRGEKRALVALRDALGLDLDMTKTGSAFGRAIAEARQVEWDAPKYTKRTQVTLEGLNALLEGAGHAFAAGAAQRVAESIPTTLTGPGWAKFVPARNKLEAVTRIASLTNSPAEWLGPGGKEHKSALTNLADRLLPGVPLDTSSKHRLGASLAHALGVPWSKDDYESTGQTLTLDGLNAILAGAERKLGLLGQDPLSFTAEAEGDALVAALYSHWAKGEAWDVKSTLVQMRDEDIKGYNQNQWQGFYFESVAVRVLNETFGQVPNPPQSKFGNCTFDYRLNHVWDMKAHAESQVTGDRVTKGRAEVILNDEQATRQCIDIQGLGFVMLNGQAVMDVDQALKVWHDEFKVGNGLHLRDERNTDRSQTLKMAFKPLSIEAFWFPNTPALDSAIASGAMAVGSQGRQRPKPGQRQGAPRRPKFQMNVNKTRAGGWRIARQDW